jgi:RNA polymerase sigma-70 factor (ECF subfamily)
MGWLFLMQFRIFINNYRAKKNMRTIEINRRLPENIQSPIGHVNHLYLQRLVERFNEFRLYLYGYSYTEIAKHLHLPLGTVQNRIFNTRRELMKLYGERETA